MMKKTEKEAKMPALQKKIAEEVKKMSTCSSPSNSISSMTKNDSESSNSRKKSEDSLATRILKPSLRMKAYKNHRQDTFHSLDMHVDHTEDIISTDITRLESLPDSVDSMSNKNADDVLKMPAIQSMRISTPTKVYKKICSDSSISSKNSTKKFINTDNSPTDSGIETNTSTNKSKKRILHTFTQPDGCIVGYVEEVDLTSTSTKNVANSKRTTSSLPNTEQTNEHSFFL